MGRYRAAFNNPDGQGDLPTYNWRDAPPGLATRRQLDCLGLRENRQDPVAQVKWMRYGREQVALLYDVARCAPKRTATPRQREALAKAVRAKKFCGTCNTYASYVIPARFGMCLDCAETHGLLHPSTPNTPPEKEAPSCTSSPS